jgi:hypothetical protein
MCGQAGCTCVVAVRAMAGGEPGGGDGGSSAAAAGNKQQEPPHRPAPTAAAGPSTVGELLQELGEELGDFVEEVMDGMAAASEDD